MEPVSSSPAVSTPELAERPAVDPAAAPVPPADPVASPSGDDAVSPMSAGVGAASAGVSLADEMTGATDQPGAVSPAAAAAAPVAEPAPAPAVVPTDAAQPAAPAAPAAPATPVASSVPPTPFPTPAAPAVASQQPATAPVLDQQAMMQQMMQQMAAMQQQQQMFAMQQQPAAAAASPAPAAQLAQATPPTPSPAQPAVASTPSSVPEPAAPAPVPEPTPVAQPAAAAVSVAAAAQPAVPVAAPAQQVAPVQAAPVQASSNEALAMLTQNTTSDGPPLFAEETASNASGGSMPGVGIHRSNSVASFSSLPTPGTMTPTGMQTPPEMSPAHLAQMSSELAKVKMQLASALNAQGDMAGAQAAMAEAQMAATMASQQQQMQYQQMMASQGLMAQQQQQQQMMAQVMPTTGVPPMAYPGSQPGSAFASQSGTPPSMTPPAAPSPIPVSKEQQEVQAILDLQPTVEIGDPTKVEKRFDNYVVYSVTTRSGSDPSRAPVVVSRRYRDFLWLHEQLKTKHQEMVVPPMPEKQAFNRFEPQFVRTRRRGLETFLNRVVTHPVLKTNSELAVFLSASAGDLDARKTEVKKEPVMAAKMQRMKQVVAYNLISKEGKRELQIDPRIGSVREFLASFDDYTKDLNMKTEKMIDARRALALAYSELGQTLTSWQNVEPTRAANLIEPVAAAAGWVSVGHWEWFARDTNAFLEPMKEYNGLAKAARSAVDNHDFELGEMHSVQSKATDLHAKAEALRSSGKHSKAEKVEVELDEAEAKLMPIKEHASTIEKVSLEELDRFERQRVADMKQYLGDLVAQQLEYSNKMRETWTQIRVAMAAKAE